MAQTHHYLFDTVGTYNDATGTTNFTNAYGSIGSSGKVNQCYQTAFYNLMDGVNAYTSTNLLPTSGAFTIAYWWKASIDGPVIRIFSMTGFYIGYSTPTGLFIESLAFSPYFYMSVNGAQSASVWTHTVIRWDGTNWSIYIDGSSATISGSTTTGPGAGGYDSSTPFQIFNQSYSNTLIDDLRIYDTAIDATEIARIYNSGTGTQADGGGPSPITSAFYKFQPFVEAAMEGIHNLGSNQLKVALTNTAPTAANSVLTDISEISYTNCSTRNVVTTASSQTSGTYKLVCTDLVLTASGAVGPFRYVVLYNDTAASKNLIAWYDYASSLTMGNGDTFTINFDGDGGVLTVT
jgi:hypothetical protein